jgi:hypothetical protein
MDRVEVENTNKQIARLFGRDLMGRPHFQVVWSNDQFETRYGEFEIFHGAIFLRSEWGVKVVKKYTYIEDRWVLERLFTNDHRLTNIKANFTYEPLFVFEDSVGNYLEPVYRAVYLLVQTALYGSKQKLRESDMEDRERKEFENDKNFIYEYLSNESPYTATMLHNREAVVVP